MSQISGSEWLARRLAAKGTTHVVWVDSVLRRTLIELGTLGLNRILAHTEKSAAYMADGYAPIAGRPGVCFAQAVGAANLAAGLKDAWLGRSPAIAMTGHKIPAQQHRKPYQEIPPARCSPPSPSSLPTSTPPPTCRGCCARLGAQPPGPCRACPPMAIKPTPCLGQRLAPPPRNYSIGVGASASLFCAGKRRPTCQGQVEYRRSCEPKLLQCPKFFGSAA